MTLRARRVIEGKTAVRVARRAVSHTTGSAKALSDAPGGTKRLFKLVFRGEDGFITSSDQQEIILNDLFYKLVLI